MDTPLQLRLARPDGFSLDAVAAFYAGFTPGSGMAAAAGIASPTIEAFTAAAEAWRPFRTWVAILCARHLAAAGGWNGPGLAKERARALRRAG